MRLFVKILSFSLFCSLVSANAFAGTITTTFADNNNGDGNMFNVTTFGHALSITSLDVHTFASTGTQTIYLYTRSGTYNGFQSTSAGWTLRDTLVVNNAAEGTPANFDVADFLLPANSLTGFFVVGDISNGSLRYTNGSLTVSDPYIQIYSGTNSGIAFAGGDHFDGDVFSPRIWNGSINYSVVPEPGMLALFGLGLAGLGFVRRRKGA